MLILKRNNMSYYRGESNETKDVFNMDIMVKKTFEDVNIYYNNDFTELRRREFYDLADEINAKEINKIAGSGALATLETVSSNYIASSAVTAAKIIDDAVTASKIKRETISTTVLGKISSNAQNKIANDAITTTKIADGAVTHEKLTTTKADGLTTSKFASASVTADKINGDFNYWYVADGAITSDKLLTSGVTAGSYTNATLTIDRSGFISEASDGA
jgi:hypothetical protein